MSVVVPVSAVTGVAPSVVCGVLLGDRPTTAAWLGIALSAPALWSRSSTSRSSRPEPPADCGRVAGGRRPGPAVRCGACSCHLCAEGLLVGAGAALGHMLYLLAVQRQLPTVAVVLAMVYPALPVILGPAPLHERLSRQQILGALGDPSAQPQVAE